MAWRDYVQIVKLGYNLFTFWHVVLIFFHPLFARVKTIKIRGKVVAFALYSFDKLHYFGVAKEHKGKGIAKKMLDKVRSKFSYLRVVHDNARALAFFKKSGFVLKHYKYTIFGKRAIFVHARAKRPLPAMLSVPL